VPTLDNTQNVQVRKMYAPYYALNHWACDSDVQRRIAFPQHGTNQSLIALA